MSMKTNRAAPRIQTNAAQSAGKVSAKLTAAMLPGTYVAKLAEEGPFAVVELKVAADASYSVRVANLDEGPSPSMRGRWRFDGQNFIGSHRAPIAGQLQLVQIGVNLNGRTLAQLKKGKDLEGKNITGKVVLGGDWFKFNLRKTDKAYFPKPSSRG